MAAGLAQEELQRVGRGLERLGDRRRCLLGRRLGLGLSLRLRCAQLDAAPVELLVDGLRLERIKLERFEHLDQVDLAELAARLRRLEESRELLDGENRLDLDGCYWIPLNRPSPGRCSRLAKLPKHAAPCRVKSSAR